MNSSRILMMSSAEAGFVIILFAPASRTADRVSMPISAVRAIMGKSRSNTSLIYLQRKNVQQKDSNKKRE